MARLDKVLLVAAMGFAAATGIGAALGIAAAAIASDSAGYSEAAPGRRDRQCRREPRLRQDRPAARPDCGPRGAMSALGPGAPLPGPAAFAKDAAGPARVPIRTRPA